MNAPSQGVSLSFIQPTGVVTLKETLATFRSEYDYKIEYEYDFSNLVCMFYIIMSHANLVLRAFFSTGQQQRGVTVLKT